MSEIRKELDVNDEAFMQIVMDIAFKKDIHHPNYFIGLKDMYLFIQERDRIRREVAEMGGYKSWDDVKKYAEDKSYEYAEKMVYKKLFPNSILTHD